MRLAAFALLLGCHAALAQGFVREDLRIPVPGSGPDGLEAILVKPEGPGRHPLAVLTNGSPRNAADRPGMTAMQQYPQALEFARRGFTAVAVLRRGYGTSGGGWAETQGGCVSPYYEAAGRTGAADLRGAIAALTTRPDVDPSEVVAVGVSAGGFAVVALAADPPPGLKAAISFAGGRGSTASDTVCAPDRLVAAFDAYGRTARLPMLFVYAANDHFFGPALAMRFRDAFTAAGGQVTFVQPDAFGADGHTLFSQKGIPVWTPIVDSFLRQTGLSPRATPLPPPGLPGVAPPPGLSANGRSAFQEYLTASPHKAFAVADTGGFGWRSGRRDAEDAAAEALRNCTEHGARCRVVMLDDAPAR